MGCRLVRVVRVDNIIVDFNEFFVTNFLARDQPQPGSLFSLERDPGNEVATSVGIFSIVLFCT